MTTLALALLALVLAGPAPWLLGRLHRLRHTPRAAMLLWQAVTLAAVLAGLGAGLSLATRHGLGRQEGASYLVAALAVAVTALVLGRLLLSGHRVGTRLRALRRRHRVLVDALGVDAQDLGARVLPLGDTPWADTPMAWCLPGLGRSRVVLTEAAVRRLGPAELAAVLAHERAHLRARHDLVLEAYTVLHRAFPKVLSSRRALDEVRLLVEVLADRAARQQVGARPLVVAIAALAGGTPEAALGAGPDGAEGATLRARLDVLLDERPRPLQATAAVLAAAAVLLLPTVLVVQPWLASLV